MQTLTNAYFGARLVPSILYIILGIILTNFVGNILSIPSEHLFLVRLVFLGVFGVCLLEVVMTRYQVNFDFLKYISLLVFQSGGRLVSIMVLIFIYPLNLSTTIYIWLIFPLLAAILGLISQPKNFIKYHYGARFQLKHMLSFSKWIAASAYSTLLFRGMDVFFLSHYVPKTEIGVYYASLNIAQILFFLANTLNIVLIPHICNLKNSQIWSFFRNGLFYGFPVFALCITIFWYLSDDLLIFIYGKEYLSGSNVLTFLLIAFFSGAFISPFVLIAYRINTPKLIFIIDLSRGIIGFLGFYLLIPHFGIEGAAISLLICYLFSAFLALSLIYNEIVAFKSS